MNLNRKDKFYPRAQAQKLEAYAGRLRAAQIRIKTAHGEQPT